MGIFRYPGRHRRLVHGFWSTTGSGNRLEKLFNLRSTPYEGPAPEDVPRILSNKKTSCFRSSVPAFKVLPSSHMRGLRNEGLQNSMSAFTLMSSMKVMSRPQGWGRCTIRRSNNTLVICSWIISCRTPTLLNIQATETFQLCTSDKYGIKIRSLLQLLDKTKKSCSDQTEPQHNLKIYLKSRLTGEYHKVRHVMSENFMSSPQ